MAFLTGQWWRVLKSLYTGGAPEQGEKFRRSLVSSVPQATYHWRYNEKAKTIVVTRNLLPWISSSDPQRGLQISTWSQDCWKIISACLLATTNLCGDYVGEKKGYRGALGANEANTDRVVVVLILRLWRYYSRRARSRRKTEFTSHTIFFVVYMSYLLNILSFVCVCDFN